MSQADQERLLDLAPDLRRVAAQPSIRTVEQAQATVADLRTKVLVVLNSQLLSPNEPFLGNLTLEEYHGLPDEEKAKLWDQWAETDLTELAEQEVNPDALFAR